MYVFTNLKSKGMCIHISYLVPKVLLSLRLYMSDVQNIIIRIKPRPFDRHSYTLIDRLM